MMNVNPSSLVQGKNKRIWRDNLSNAVLSSKDNTGGQRFGQFIYNAIANTDDIRNVDDYDTDFHSRLFYISDEDMIQALTSWLEWLKENTPVLEGVSE